MLVRRLLLVDEQRRASNVTEFPDNGSEQMGRGGAWVARASDPLATLYNPAGLAGQPSKLTLQVNLPLAQTCFHRMRDPNDTTLDTALLDTNQDHHYPNVCNDLGTFPVPSLGFTIRATPRVGIGFLLTAPSGAAAQAWPEFTTTSSGTYPAPERYLATYTNAFFLTPTLGVGVEPIDNLRFGASFIAGIANATFSNGSHGRQRVERRPALERHQGDAHERDRLRPRLHARRPLEPHAQRRHLRLVQVERAGRRERRREDVRELLQPRHRAGYAATARSPIAAAAKHPTRAAPVAAT